MYLSIIYLIIYPSIDLSFIYDLSIYLSTNLSTYLLVSRDFFHTWNFITIPRDDNTLSRGFVFSFHHASLNKNK